MLLNVWFSSSSSTVSLFGLAIHVDAHPACVAKTIVGDRNMVPAVQYKRAFGLTRRASSSQRTTRLSCSLPPAQTKGVARALVHVDHARHDGAIPLRIDPGTECEPIQKTEIAMIPGLDVTLTVQFQGHALHGRHVGCGAIDDTGQRALLHALIQVPRQGETCLQMAGWRPLQRRPRGQLFLPCRLGLGQLRLRGGELFVHEGKPIIECGELLLLLGSR